MRLILWTIIILAGVSGFYTFAQASDYVVSQATLVSDELIWGDPLMDEGELRYASDFRWQDWVNAPAVPLLVRDEGAIDEATPMGQMVTHDMRTGITIYSDPDRSDSMLKGVQFHAGTHREESDDASKDFTHYALVPDPTILPYRDKVKLFMRWTNAVGDTTQYSVASGTLIGPTTVITAGHCVYNTDRGWAATIIVVPAFGNATNPYGVSTSIQLHSWSGWTESADYDHDIGIIDLDRPVGMLTGYEGLGTNSSCSFFTSGDWEHSDYPAEDGFDGQNMYTEVGNYDGCETFGNEVWYDRSGYGGSSGGGAIRDGGAGTGVWAVRSNTYFSIDTGFDSWDTRITSTKFTNIVGYLEEDIPPSIDFIPLNVEVETNTAIIGQYFPTTSFKICNTSEILYQDIVEFDLYISTDDNISTADLRLASYQVDLYGVSADSPAELVQLAGGTVPPELTPGQYYMGVIVTTPDWNPNNNDTDGWDAAPITLFCEPADMTSLLSPADNSTCMDSSITFNWNHVPSAIGYKLFLTETNAPVQVYEVSTHNLTLNNLTPGKGFWWNVASVGPCGDVAQSTPTWSLTTLGHNPVPPNLVFPAEADSCLSTEVIYFNWDAVEGATDYELRVGTSCGTGNVYYSSVTQLGVTDLLPGTNYYWTVRAVDGCSQWGDWSACQSFYTGPTMTSISGLRTPFYNQEGISVPVLLEWEDTPQASSYIVRFGFEPGIGGDHLTYLSEYLVEGLQFDSTYYWKVRPVSPCGQLGSWSPEWAFTTTGSGPNLTMNTTAGWAASVVPRTANDATVSLVPEPAQLVGDSLRTYWNMDGTNDGDQSNGLFQNQLLVDGEYAHHKNQFFSNPGEPFRVLNYGPVTVRGGMHTFECFLDANNIIDETNEGDNNWAKQWTWMPTTIAPGDSYVRQSPPDMLGGLDAIPWTEIKYANCDGVRVNTSGWWNAVVVHPMDILADYDVTLNYPTSDPNSGFVYYQAISMRPSGCTDAVFVNRNVAGSVEEWDTGIYRQSGTGDYRISHTVSTGIDFGSTEVLNFDQDEMLILKEVNISEISTGWISIIVDVDPAEGPLYFIWLDKTFHMGSMLNFTAIGATDSLGHLALTVEAPNSGYYCGVVFRDAIYGTEQMEVSLEIGPPVPDLAIATPANWHAPIVPHIAFDIPYPFDEVDAPAYLLGDTTGTHYYINVYNDSPVDIPSYRLSAQLDGNLDLFYDLITLPAFGSFKFHGGGLMWVRGGLHTLALVLDPLSTLDEAWENNNSFAGQWGWIPVEHVVGVPGTRSTPPDKSGGTDMILATEFLWPNSDGLRTPVISPLQSRKWIVGTAILPLDEDADYDLTLHPRDDNASTAFREGHTTSSWAAGQSDFAVISMRTAAEYQWDIGVTKNSGRGDYIYHTTQGPNLGVDPMGNYGPSPMAPNEILALYEAYLNPGSYTATVVNDSGTIDWGISVIDQSIAFANKSDTYDDGVSSGISYLAGPGMDEQVEFEVFEAGYFGLAVWKVGSADAPKGGRFTLQLNNPLSGVTAGGSQTPTVSTISSVWPNPFNPSTTISFDLAMDERADISVFDLQGRLVKRLLSESRSAGSHEVLWNGTDQRGQPVTSGIYFVRLKTGSATRTQKIALVR